MARVISPFRSANSSGLPLVAAVVLLAIAVFVVAWVGIEGSRADSLQLLVLQGKALVESLARAAESAMASEENLDHAVNMRFADIVRRLEDLRTQRTEDSDLLSIAMQHELLAIYVLDSAVEPVAQAVVRGTRQGLPAFVLKEAAQLMKNPEERFVLLLDQNDHDGTAVHYYLELTGSGNGVAVLVADAGFYVAALRKTQIGFLAQNMAREKGVEYVIYQSTEGIVFASREIDHLLSIESDTFLTAAIDRDTTVVREYEFQNRPVMEVVRPFATTDYPVGVLRVGLSLESYYAVARGFDRLMLGLAAALCVLSILVVLYVNARKRRREIGRRFDEMKSLTDRIFDQMRTGVAVVDSSGVITMTNDAFEQVMARRGCVGCRWDDLLGGTRFAWERLSQTSGAASEVEGEVVQGEKRRNLLMGISTIGPEAGSERQTIAVVYDLTRFRKYEREARRRERLSEMGNMAAGVAHEIRNPLNAIAIAAQRLALEFHPQADSDSYHSITDQIKSETKRLNSIITRFLSLAHVGEGQMQPIELGQLLDQFAEFVRPEAAKLGIDLSVDITDQVVVQADHDKLRQVLLNLFNNSKEALAGKAGRVAVTVRADSGAVVIEFADSGPGIPESEREEVFKPFFTTKDAGTGLGLTTAYRIIEEMGGRIEIGVSSLGGAAFIITLSRR